jgi:molybdopterin biosynthesis enzyme
MTQLQHGKATIPELSRLSRMAGQDYQFPADGQLVVVRVGEVLNSQALAGLVSCGVRTVKVLQARRGGCFDVVEVEVVQ